MKTRTADEDIGNYNACGKFLFGRNDNLAYKKSLSLVEANERLAKIHTVSVRETAMS